MPYKNDDFEKLLRKAARHYPLNTDSADWAELAAKLESSKKLVAKNNKTKYAIIFLLAGIIIGSLSINKFINSHSENVEKNKFVATKIEDSMFSLVPFPNRIETNKSNESLITLRRNNKKLNNKVIYSFEDVLPELDQNTLIEDAEFKSPISNIGIVKSNAFDNSIFLNKTAIISTTYDLPGNILPEQKPVALKLQNADIAADATSVHIDAKPAKRIYGVAYGGPMFTIVKFQKATSPGYKAGVALGYKTNNGLSIELGLQREHINFYSDGKYVDTTLLRIKKNTDVEKANASSKITSVPFTLRYNFLSKNNGHFFAAIGVNGVIITHSEKFNYEVSKDGVEGNLSKKYSALTSPKYFSGFNISAGYQTKLAKTWSIKAEPYYQAPVKNFGVGKLPVSSFGIDIGIVKDLK